MIDRRAAITSRIRELEHKRSSIADFVQRNTSSDPITKRYMLPAYMDFEEVSSALSKYRGKLKMIEDEIALEKERSWDWDVMQKEYDY